MRYTCKVCGKEVVVENGQISRNCGHDNAGVIAHCSAQCYGEGGAEESRGMILARTIRQMIAFIKGAKT